MPAQLTVKPHKRKDIGRGFASIDRETMAELGVSSGEFVALEDVSAETERPFDAASPADAVGEEVPAEGE